MQHTSGRTVFTATNDLDYPAGFIQLICAWMDQVDPGRDHECLLSLALDAKRNSSVIGWPSGGGHSVPPRFTMTLMTALAEDASLVAAGTSCMDSVLEVMKGCPGHGPVARVALKPAGGNSSNGLSVYGSFLSHLKAGLRMRLADRYFQVAVPEHFELSSTYDLSGQKFQEILNAKVAGRSLIIHDERHEVGRDIAEACSLDFALSTGAKKAMRARDLRFKIGQVVRLGNDDTVLPLSAKFWTRSWPVELAAIAILKGYPFEEVLAGIDPIIEAIALDFSEPVVELKEFAFMYLAGLSPSVAKAKNIRLDDLLKWVSTDRILSRIDCVYEDYSRTVTPGEFFVDAMYRSLPADRPKLYQAATTHPAIMEGMLSRLDIHDQQLADALLSPLVRVAALSILVCRVQEGSWLGERTRWAYNAALFRKWKIQHDSKYKLDECTGNGYFSDEGVQVALILNGIKPLIHPGEEGRLIELLEDIEEMTVLSLAKSGLTFEQMDAVRPDNDTVHTWRAVDGFDL